VSKLTGWGSIFNAISVIIGSLLGLFIGKRLPARVSEIIMQSLGGVTIIIGMQMALKADTGSKIIIVLLSMVIGSIIGELINIDGFMDRLGHSLQTRFGQNGHKQDFTKAFVAASLLFCVGPMSILGALNDGLSKDYSLLYIKSFLDGISSLTIAATLGIGTMFSAVVILVYQGAITIFAESLRGLFTTNVVEMLTATGGVLVLAIGFNIWKLSNFRVANMLPALILSVFAAYVYTLI
jgi:uncharacterized membrane protein YqgA involved in biofilm formation